MASQKVHLSRRERDCAPNPACGGGPFTKPSSRRLFTESLLLMLIQTVRQPLVELDSVMPRGLRVALRFLGKFQGFFP